MTLKGLRDGAFTAGIMILWCDVLAGHPTGIIPVLLVTVPTVMRVVEAMRNTKGDA